MHKVEPRETVRFAVESKRERDIQELTQELLT